MRFKVGDKVRITNNTFFHHYEIGSIVTIAEVRRMDYLCEERIGGYQWYIIDKDCEPANNSIKLKIKQL